MERETPGFRAVAVVLVVLLTLLAWTIRFAQARESLWLDELHTAWVVADGWGDVAPRAQAGNQASPYFFLVATVTRLTGLTELGLRLPSLMAGVALVPATFALVRRGTNCSAAGLAAATIAVADRDFLFYATEARVYALVQLLALVRLGVFVQSLTTPNVVWRGAYVFLVVAMFYLHYTTALLWTGEAAAVFGASLLRPPRRPRGLPFLVDSVVAGLLCLPAAPHLAEVFQRRENWERFIRPPTWEHLTAHQFRHRLAPWACYLAPPAICALLSLRMQAAKDRKKAIFSGQRVLASPAVKAADDPLAPRRLLALVGVWIAVPALAAWSIAITGVAPLFLYRYGIGAATAVPVLAGMLCGVAASQGWRRLASAATIAAALWSVVPSYVLQALVDGRLIADRNEDWRTAVAYLRGLDDRLPVLVYAGLIEADAYAASPDPLLRDFCVLPVLGAYRLSPHRSVYPFPLGRRAVSPELCRAVVGNGGAWALIRCPPHIADDLIETMRRRLERCAAGVNTVESRRFGGVTAARFAFASRTSTSAGIPQVGAMREEDRLE